ncbi:mediator of RNA polymerase II transcription subunit 15 isoform X2 [Periplaneta americana]|uniref:mediator of RNA polymerase II transcription subunit 15 isoform X2 n=1 Tax=Periplaneta americana TaxID=6978 RepID=UPI0037E87DFA
MEDPSFSSKCSCKNEEYLGFVARLILHVREMNSKKGAGMNVPGGGGGQAAQDPIGALQTLARQGTGNQIMGLGGPPGGGMVQPSSIAASNLLQTLNRPQGISGMQPMQNKMPPDMGMGPGPQVGPPMVGLPGQMQTGPIPNVPCPNQMPGQIPTQMRVQLPGQMGGQLPNQIQSQSLGQMSQIPGQMGGQMAPGQMPGQMGHMPQMQQARKGGETIMMTGQNAGFSGPRNVASNAFLRQSPSPSALQASPAGLGAAPPSNQMAASPALVPSPSSQLTPMSTAQRSGGMAPSPSSSLNTPGPAVPTPSPCSLQEDQAYREKVRQLSKYIEPLRRMINRMGNDDVEKLSKMKKLLEILSNPSKRMPLETLLKCEVVLEKLDLKRGEGSVAPQATHLIPLKEHHIFNPLLEAVNNTLQSPVANHTLQRTFGPCLEALFGPEIKMLPPPLKKKKVEETPNDIPDVLQGEIARLDQRFKVSLDPTQQPGSRSVQLLCWLDDRHLPCVPPVSLSVPEDYPRTPPRCHMAPHEHSSTQFLSAVQKALASRIRKLPSRFSVSQLLDTWEMSVRQASAPTQTPVSAATVLMGL